jgi:indolepyruvate ferredoxin oxidoreductase beta subunit
MSGQPQRPLTLLIAALGGEGGGVLTNWIVAAAAKLGLPAQSTSIPGVAQRTGSTTYYIEIFPTPWRELGDRRPVLALVPGVGDIDVMMASELLEAGRAVTGGFVTPDRTLVVASTHRSFVMTEKTAMGDGRLDAGRLIEAIGAHARQSVFLDLDQLAEQSGAMVNAVMLGVLAGSGALPIPPEAFEDAIRADGKAVDSNLRGFGAGLDAIRQGQAAAGRSGKRWRRSAATLEGLEREIAASLPAAVREVAIEGVRRLATYQDLAYARLYLDRLAPIAAADEHAGMDGKLLSETARHLALRMSFEDVIRVAQAKTDPARYRRIVEEVRAQPGEPVRVVDFFKPGIEELCSILPSRLARPILAVAERRQWLGRVYWGLEVDSTSVPGFLRLWLLAKLKRFRPASHRFREEQAAIESWLALVAEAAQASGPLAFEVAQCARLFKGYGDTHKRGSDNYRMIETRVIRPALAGRYPASQAIDAVASARTAALADPEGEGLTRCLAEIETRAPVEAAAAE